MARIPAIIVELFELLALLVGSAAVSLVGVALELTGVEAVTGGDLALGLWALVMGAAALYAGVVALGYEQVLPRARALVGDA
ncbi:hypothetical protein J2751_001282 [Halorubrum alkaliphilum]|uniref:DUF8151 domain-containing protein n=1 Tax=Halorubrum alkaliphilum TaxID=261290 RepID=A0A8T4GDR1_9EURY|nr:hypothetical protein [Halorubrum alkaliphilum]MBP1922276.1 hypothetical protein [Halorubrum alkaliphilum]